MNRKEEIKKEAHDFFNNMNDDEFIELLEGFGVEVEEGDGEGKIVFTNETEISWQAKSRSSFSISQKNNFNSNNKTRVDNKFPLNFPLAC